MPTDFSETSKVALTYAKELASTYHGSVHLLHVLPDPDERPWPFGVDPEAFELSSEERMKRWEAKALEQMKSLLPETEQKELNAQFATRVGHSVLQILHYAKDQAADLIVMGTHGQGAASPQLGTFQWNPPIGSVAERVVRQSPCPALIVRLPGDKAVIRPEERLLT